MTTHFSKNVVEAYYKFKQEDVTVVECEQFTLQALIGPVQGLRIFDAGCGYGAHALWLHSLGAKVVGTDVSKDQITKAKQLAQGLTNLEYHQIANEELSSKLEGEEFDLVLAVFCLQYCESSDVLRRVLDNMYQLLRPNGRVVGVFPVPQSAQVAAKYGYRTDYSPQKHVPGSIYTDTVPLGSGTEFRNSQLLIDKTLLSECAEAVGFEKTEFFNPRITERGIEEKGEEFWREFQNIPLWQFFVCTA